MKNKFIILFTFSISFYTVFSQERTYQIRTIAFYNLENLFDTINDPETEDEKSPIMELQRNRSRVYQDKLHKLASVIAQIGKDKSSTAPIIIGVAEVENREVLEDLIQTAPLRSKRYEIIHYDSKDRRGIDVALLYQSSHFTPIHHEAFDPKIYKDGYKVLTRDQLLVSGYIDDELIHIIVNHWPSRRGGESATKRLREKAAYQNTKIIHKIREEYTNPKIIIMGDFNDDPVNSSFKEVLKTIAKKEELTKGSIYNPYESMFFKGMNSLGHWDQINLFDQILVTLPLVHKNNNDFSTYKLFKAAIFNKQFLITSTGKYKGYPFRSFSRSNYTGGYSDHFPVYIYLIKEAK